MWTARNIEARQYQERHNGESRREMVNETPWCGLHPVISSWLCATVQAPLSGGLRGCCPPGSLDEANRAALARAIALHRGDAPPETSRHLNVDP